VTADRTDMVDGDRVVQLEADAKSLGIFATRLGAKAAAQVEDIDLLAKMIADGVPVTDRGAAALAGRIQERADKMAELHDRVQQLAKTMGDPS
jgi:hypothetical protein